MRKKVSVFFFNCFLLFCVVAFIFTTLHYIAWGPGIYWFTHVFMDYILNIGFWLVFFNSRTLMIYRQRHNKPTIENYWRYVCHGRWIKIEKHAIRSIKKQCEAMLTCYFYFIFGAQHFVTV